MDFVYRIWQLCYSNSTKKNMQKGTRNVRFFWTRDLGTCWIGLGTNIQDPKLQNQYGLLAPGRRQNLERLIKPELYIDVATEYLKNPFKAAYKLNQVSSQPIYNQQRSGEFAYG